MDFFSCLFTDFVLFTLDVACLRNVAGWSSWQCFSFLFFFLQFHGVQQVAIARSVVIRITAGHIWNEGNPDGCALLKVCVLLAKEFGQLDFFIWDSIREELPAGVEVEHKGNRVAEEQLHAH